MPDALLLVGRDRYEDPWHDFAATGARVARSLDGLGVGVDWRSTFPDALAGMSAPDLVVVLAGRSPSASADESTAADWRELHNRLLEFVNGGSALLVLHAASNTFSDFPRWAELVGGRWVEDRSTHPPLGEAVFTSVGLHPIVSNIETVRAFDEQYLNLEVAPTSEPFLVTHHAGTSHPVAWVAATPPGRGRVVYDGLGHDTRSYDSAERVALLGSEISWLLAGAGRRLGGRRAVD
jgi:type 1 glutamine amidotransferase